jgi:hypothetical protein
MRLLPHDVVTFSVNVNTPSKSEWTVTLSEVAPVVIVPPAEIVQCAALHVRARPARARGSARSHEAAAPLPPQARIRPHHLRSSCRRTVGSDDLSMARHLPRVRSNYFFARACKRRDMRATRQTRGWAIRWRTEHEHLRSSLEADHFGQGKYPSWHFTRAPLELTNDNGVYVRPMLRVPFKHHPTKLLDLDVPVEFRRYDE